MRFEETPLPGVWVIEVDMLGDERGWFARTFDVEELRARGLSTRVVQCNVSYSPRRGTLRGLHYQAAPHGEPKLVRCVRGATFHVALDLRPESPSYLRWHSVELSATSLRAVYLPPGVAHGLQTLADDCEVLYQMGHRHVPEFARGVRWDDPAFAIRWPPVAGGGARTLSARDRSFADWEIPGAWSRSPARGAEESRLLGSGA
jgi:dTDP-4-dehydrorhamnose 3,5-epimerase